ncbi:MAG TPA: hypothetical protein VH328_03670 [Burkholderiaceae bacterium]|nr:hypothetical protein [Burkholderiaceae bacterium]
MQHSRHAIPHWRLTTLATLAASSLLASCGGSGLPGGSNGGEAPLTVPKVTACTTGDNPESALQGQVPASMRAAGFTGFNCNLKLVSQFQGEGGNWSAAKFDDGAGHTCAYHATAVPNANRINPGVPVIDMTDRSNLTRTMSLTTPSMTDPWESLRVNERRQILIADNGQNGGGGPEVDLYDLSGDCRSPQLLASLPVGTGNDGGITMPNTPIGHEGNIAPDGLTYYVGDLTNAQYYAVDVANTTKPKMIANFAMSTLGIGSNVHGLSVTNDGNRMYGVILGGPAFNAPPAVLPLDQVNNGFAVFDTSEVQARVPNAQIKLISKVLYQDGSVAQHTIPITVGGQQYLVMVDEGGSAGLAGPEAAQVACDAGLSPFPMARIFSLADETNPTLVSKLMLETHDPKNCAQVIPDIAGLSIFTYGSHYCSVDNRDNATVLACSYFNSGIRVFDIRNPAHPKEIAYYNPPSSPTAEAGSSHAVFGQYKAGGPDWCASRLDFDYANKQLITMCQDNGEVILSFEGATNWPFAESTASTSQN